MLAARMLLVILLFERLNGAENASREAPSYTPSSIANAASDETGALAPNTIAYVKGDGLAYLTRALLPGDVSVSGTMPTLLPGTGVRVAIGNITAHLYYVSPKQVNFLVPANLLPGPLELQMFLDGAAGPKVPLRIAETSPAFFEMLDGFALTARADGSLVTPAAPAAPGEIVVTYATGLGETTPPQPYGQVARVAAPVRDPAGAVLAVGGRAIESEGIQYIGISPGFAGLYQINWQVPDWAAGTAELRLTMGESRSKEGVRIAIR